MTNIKRIVACSLVSLCVLVSAASAESEADRIPELINALGDANVRIGAAVALAKLGKTAVPVLRKSLVSKDADIRVWSAYTLGLIGSDAKPAVGDLALAHPDAATRAVVAEAMGKIGPSASAAVPALAKAIKDEDVDVRRRSAISLGQIGSPSKSALPGLIEVLSDSEVRFAVRTALVQIGTATVDPLLKSLDDDKLRFDALLVLRKIDPARVKQMGLDQPTIADLPSLRIVLFDPSRKPAERTAAAMALGSLGKDAIPVLIEAMEHQQLARTAARAFAKVGPVAVPRLIAALKHDRPAVRAAATDAFGHMGPAASRATPKLVELLKDSDRNVRYHAVRALHTFGKKAKPAVPVLAEVVLNAKETEPTRQWAIKTLIVTLPETHDVVVKTLIQASKDKSNYGVSSLARQQVRLVDVKAAEAAGIK